MVTAVSRCGLCCPGVYCGKRIVVHIMPSSPMPGRPATLTPRPPSPAGGSPLGFISGLHGGECCLCYQELAKVLYHQLRECFTYLRPFRFLYLLPQTSHLYGFSFSIPRVPGYGVDVSGLTMEKVPSPFSCNCWV